MYKGKGSVMQTLEGLSGVSLLCWNGNFLKAEDEGRIPLHSHDTKEPGSRGLAE